MVDIFLRQTVCLFVFFLCIENNLSNSYGFYLSAPIFGPCQVVRFSVRRKSYDLITFACQPFIQFFLLTVIFEFVN